MAVAGKTFAVGPWACLPENASKPGILVEDDFPEFLARHPLRQGAAIGFAIQPYQIIPGRTLGDLLIRHVGSDAGAGAAGDQPSHAIDESRPFILSARVRTFLIRVNHGIR